MKKWYLIFCACFVVPVIFLFGFSLFDKDKDTSGSEELAQFPEFSVKALFSGDFTKGFEDYFTDQFPFRKLFMSGSKALNSIYTINFGDDIHLDVDIDNTWEHGGSIDPDKDNDVIQTIATTSGTTSDSLATGSTPVSGSDGSSNASGHTTAGTTQAPETTAPETTFVTSWEELESPWGDEDVDGGNVSESSGILIIGDRAMERVYGVSENLDSYAEVVNRLYDAVGQDMRVYAMLVPKSIEFNAPSAYRSGVASQLNAINYAYSNLKTGIICVDAYSELFAHRSEDIYFRTDHHWSQRGAYYGYRAFCESANLTPYDLSKYTYEVVPGFLGTMYLYTQNYAASSVLKNNPDDVEIFRPLTVATMDVFKSPDLSDGVVRNIIYSSEYANDSLSAEAKYLVFLGGDQPICHVVNESVTNGRKLLIIKESYGNAFSPFACDMFEEVWMIDPREFNGKDLPFTDLADFAREQGITDLLILNNVQSAVPSYMKWVDALLGQ